MMKKIYTVLLLCFMLAACGDEQTPRSAVSSYITLLYQGKIEEAYKLICKNDQTANGIVSFKEKNFDYHDPLFRPFYEQAAFTIKDVTENQNAAVVIAEQDILDHKTVYTLCNQVHKNGIFAEKHEKRHEVLAKSLNGRSPFVKSFVTYFLVKEHGQWKIRYPVQ